MGLPSWSTFLHYVGTFCCAAPEAHVKSQSKPQTLFCAHVKATERQHLFPWPGNLLSSKAVHLFSFFQTV